MPSCPVYRINKKKQLTPTILLNNQIHLTGYEERENRENFRNNHHHKLTLKILILSIIVSTIIANVIILFSGSDNNKQSTSLWTLNITAGIVSGLGIIAIYRNGIQGLHGKSYLFLALGIICWFSADLIILYYYYDLGPEGVEEQERVSVADSLWFSGYVLLGLHLLIIIRLLGNIIKPRIVILVSIITILFVSYIVLTLISSKEEKERMSGNNSK